MLKNARLFESSKIYIWLFLFFLFTYLLTINFFMPLWVDDYARSLPLTNWTKIFSLVYNTYFGWSGRITVMFFTFLFLWKDTLAIPIFNILNSLVFVLMVYLIFLNAFARNPRNFKDLALLIIIFCLLWFLPTSLGAIAFWKTGAIGYLWPLTGTLAFIYPVMRLVLDDSNIVADNFVVRIMFLIAGLLLGSCLENLSAAICIFLAGSIVYLKYRKCDCPQWFCYAFFGYIIGSILLVIAPGNFKRAATLTGHYSLAYKFFYLAFKILVHFIPFLLIFLLIIFLLRKVKYKISLEQFRRFYLFMGLSLFAAFAMGGVPQVVFFGGRTAFASDVFAIVALASLFPVDNDIFYAKFIRPIILFILLPLLLFDMTNVFLFYHTAFIENKLRQEIIVKELARNNKEIVVPAMRVSEESKYWWKRFSAYRCFVDDIGTDSNFWKNQIVKGYYGLDSIRVEK